MLTVESYAFSMISYKKIHFEFFGRIFVKFQSKQATVESCPYPIASPRAGALLSGEYQLNLVEYGPEPCTLSIICLHPGLKKKITFYEIQLHLNQIILCMKTLSS